MRHALQRGGQRCVGLRRSELSTVFAGAWRNVKRRFFAL